MKEIKRQKRSYCTKKRLICAAIAVLLIVAGATLWIVSNLGTLKGPWSSILPVIFTALGATFALFEWLLPVSIESSVNSENLNPVKFEPEQSRKPHIQIQDIDLGVNNHTGAIIIYAKKSMLTPRIDLLRNPIMPLAHSTSSIVQRSVNNQLVYVATFPYLEPSDYIAGDVWGFYRTKITVLPNQVTEIDWRGPKMKTKTSE